MPITVTCDLGDEGMHLERLACADDTTRGDSTRWLV